MHEHKYQPKPNALEACECGAMRVVESAETVARRDAATVAFKRRVNARFCRECRHPLTAHRNDYDCRRCACDAFIPMRYDLPLDAEAVFVAPPNARRVN